MTLSHDTARQDLNQLDIEQLRCGVMLQLDTIEALTNERNEWKTRCEFSFAQRDKLTAERDAYAKAADAMAMSHKIERDDLRSTINAACISAIRQEREIDELKAAARMALDALTDARYVPRYAQDQAITALKVVL